MSSFELFILLLYGLGSYILGIRQANNEWINSAGMLGRKECRGKLYSVRGGS